MLVFLPNTGFAQGTAEAPATPGLVVPKEEVSEEVAPGQELPSLSAPVVEENVGSLAGAFLSSYVAHSEGNLTQALSYLRDAHRRDPANSQIAGQVLILEITLGHMDLALKQAQQLHKAEKRELIVDLMMAINAVKEGKLADASTLLKSAESKSFDHIWAPLLLQWMQPTDGELKPVQAADVVKGEGAVPSFVHYHTALLNDMRGFNKEAEEQYQQSIRDLARAPFRALLAYVNMKARANDTETIQQLLLDLKASRPDMEELLRKEAPYLNDLTNTATLPKEKFIHTAQQGVAEVLLTMASMLYTLDISQDIPLYLQMAIYLKPDFPTAQLMLGNYFESLKLWDEAVAQYKRIHNTGPLYLKSAIRHTHVLELQDRTQEASELMMQLTKQFPNSIDVWMAAGDLERSRSQFEKATHHYGKAIDLLGNNYVRQHWVMFFTRGASYEQLGKIVEAERDLRQARNLSSDQPEVLNYIGYMWLDQDKKVFEAVKLIKKAYRLAPHEPHIIDSMGWAFFKTGKLDKAIAMLEHAAELIPNDPTVNEHLGDAYWHSDRILEARYQWKRAKDFAEDAKQAAVLERKIRDGLATYSFHTSPISGALPSSEGKDDAADHDQ